MSPNLFNKDLSRAQSKQIHGVSDLVRGDEHGAIKFTYSHDSVPKPVVIHMIARDCMTYPQNSGFVIFSESDDTDYDIPRFLDSVCQKQKWSDIEGAVRVIATALTSAIEKRDQGTSDSSSGSDDSLWDYGSDSEDLEPIETTRADGDHQNSHGHDDHAVVHSPSASTLATLSNSLKKAQSVGIAVGVYPRPGSDLPAVVSLAVPTTCLGVDAGILEAWGLRQTENLVLLIKIDREYPTLAEFLDMSIRQTALRFRFGRCLGAKPSPASLQSAYNDTNLPFHDALTLTDDETAQNPFELISMSNSIDKLLNAEFNRILEMKRRCKLPWPHAQRLVSQKELQSETHCVQAEETNSETLELQADMVPFQNLIGPVSQDAALDEPEAFSLPLVAMQFALHRLANCTRYCMVCNSCLKKSSSALKPYVCSTSLCLFQYLTLGLGSTIEHEIMNAPYVVDMLICFLYAALSDSTSRELPDGLGIKTAYVDDVGDKWAEGSYVAATADMQLMKLRNLDYSTLQKHPWAPFRKGDRVLLVHRKEIESVAWARQHRVVKSWCQLKEYVQGEWILECHSCSDSPYGSPRNSPISKLSDTPIPGGNWREVMLFGYWQNIDDLELDRRRSALLNILDGIPSVLEMREYLMAQPGRRLASWARIHKSELTVLNWTVASNRSLIVQDDVIEGSNTKEMTPRNDSRVFGDDGQDMLEWMQFRFLQGSPETEQRFEHKVRQLSETTRTPTIFAWHGSSLKNWHSIIRTGLDYSVVEHGRSAGNGVYFSKSMTTSLSYSKGCLRAINRFGGWPKSELQISSAIAVCELINCPDEFVSRQPYVVDKLDWIQCRYLLVGTNPSAKAINFPFYQPQTSETPAHVDQDKNYRIIGPDGPVEIPITAIPLSRRALHSKRPIPEPAPTWNRLLLKLGVL